MSEAQAVALVFILLGLGLIALAIGAYSTRRKQKPRVEYTPLAPVHKDIPIDFHAPIERTAVTPVVPIPINEEKKAEIDDIYGDKRKRDATRERVARSAERNKPILEALRPTDHVPEIDVMPIGRDNDPWGTGGGFPAGKPGNEDSPFAGGGGGESGGGGAGGDWSSDTTTDSSSSSDSFDSGGDAGGSD